MKENNRISYLGLLKFIASLAIIFYHSKTIMTSHWGAICFGGIFYFYYRILHF